MVEAMKAQSFFFGKAPLLDFGFEAKALDFHMVALYVDLLPSNFPASTPMFLFGSHHPVDHHVRLCFASSLCFKKV